MQLAGQHLHYSDPIVKATKEIDEFTRKLGVSSFAGILYDIAPWLIHISMKTSKMVKDMPKRMAAFRLDIMQGIEVSKK